MTDAAATATTEEVKLEPFNYLTGNIKGTFTHELTSKCVAFVGRNRHGKTARLDAFRLALLGKHPVGPHASDLLELVPEGAAGLHVAVRSPGAASSYSVVIEGKKPKKDAKPNRDGLLRVVEQLPGGEARIESCLPSLSMRELIAQGSTLSREAIFQRFGHITAVPSPRGLNADQKALWAEGLAAVRSDNPKADTAQVLTEVSSWFRKRKLALGREAGALEKLITQREAALGPEAAGSEELPQLRAQYEQALAWERAASLREARKSLEAQVVEYRAKVAPLQEADLRRPALEAELVEERRALVALAEDLGRDVETARTRLAEGRQRHGEERRREEELLIAGEWVLATIRRARAKADENGQAPCLLCGALCSPEDQEAQVAPRVEARRASLSTLGSRHQVEEGELLAALRSAEEAHAAQEARVRTWDAARKAEQEANAAERSQLMLEYSRLDGALKQNKIALDAAPAAYDGPTSQEIYTRMEALQNAETARRQLEAEVAKLRQIALDQSAAKTLEEEAGKLLDKLLAETAEAANAAVNRYMPEGFAARLDLETVQWTVIGRDDRPHPKRVMAGSEFGALVPALALAWTEGAPGRYLTLDDEDLAFFDPPNLALLLETLKKATDDGLLTQVLVAWSRGHEIPDSWQKIAVDSATRPERIDTPPPVARLLLTDADDGLDGLL